MHIPLAAVDWRPTASGVKASSTMYFCSFFKMLASMLSLSYFLSLSRKPPSESTSFLAVSQSGFFWSMMQIASIVSITPDGGVLKPFTSTMSPLVSESSAFTALFSAGSATSRSFCASAAMASTISCCLATSATSTPTFSCMSDASAWSMATFLSMASASIDFSTRTGSRAFRSVRRPSTSALVSSSFWTPTTICSFFTLTTSWRLPSFSM
mmetsp:Transcript_19517/g.40924  ORF Transcript_19517/g.40924 Transcript_19517/m.40924 type:complete len:211 (+) Transcript_19517:3788-4420(+)